MKNHHALIVPIGFFLLLSLKGAAFPAYFHVGFNSVESGYFAPVYGQDNDKKAGFITPAIEHDAKDGALLIPGVSWNPLNIGYIGSVSQGVGEFFRGKVAIGPSVQLGETAKMGLRWLCQGLPQWNQDARYGFIKALLAPGTAGAYLDAGVYGAEPLNALGSTAALRRGFEIDAAGAVVKRF